MPTRYAECHPDQKHKAFGLCKVCYRRKRFGQEPRRKLKLWADCHPTKAHIAKGLCGKCYHNNYNKTHPIPTRVRHRRADAKRTTNASWRKAHLRRNFGITLEQYTEMLVKQGGVCAVCGGLNPTPTRRLAVDHDHKTGKIRGLLCGPCNLHLGKFEDSIWLAQIGAYLDNCRK